MDSLRHVVDSVLAWLLLPATLFGAGGAAIHAVRKNRSLKQVLFEAGGGILVANMLGPIMAAHAPEQWHYTLYFLVGWGGLEAVGRLYEIALSGAEKRLQQKMGITPPLATDNANKPWDGVERRKQPTSAVSSTPSPSRSTD